MLREPLAYRVSISMIDQWKLREYSVVTLFLDARYVLQEAQLNERGVDGNGATASLILQRLTWPVRYVHVVNTVLSADAFDCKLTGFLTSAELEQRQQRHPPSLWFIPLLQELRGIKHREELSIREWHNPFGVLVSFFFLRREAFHWMKRPFWRVALF